MADTDYSDEEWRTIPYAIEYEVSSLGRVRRTVARERCQAGRVIKTSLAGPRRNYVYVGFVHNDGVRRTKGMHVVMLESFIGPKPAGHEGAHRDGNSRRNYIDNLAWKTPKENAADRALHGTQTRGEKYGAGKLDANKVRLIRSFVGSQRETAKTFGISQSMVTKIKNGKAWAHVR
jgi:hypothetical protein